MSIEIVSKGLISTVERDDRPLDGGFGFELTDTRAAIASQAVGNEVMLTYTGENTPLPVRRHTVDEFMLTKPA